MNCPPTWWPNTKPGLYPFIEERFPKVFEDLKEKEAIDDDLEKLMNEALTAYGEEFKDTI
jgi:F-type H+-transporting ATPase subunit alpha